MSGAPEHAVFVLESLRWWYLCDNTQSILALYGECRNPHKWGSLLWWTVSYLQAPDTDELEALTSDDEIVDQRTASNKGVRRPGAALVVDWASLDAFQRRIPLHIKVKLHATDESHLLAHKCSCESYSRTLDCEHGELLGALWRNPARPVAFRKLGIAPC